MKHRLFSLIIILLMALSIFGCVFVFAPDGPGIGDIGGNLGIPGIGDEGGNQGGSESGEGNGDGEADKPGSSLPAPTGPVTPSADGYTFETHPSEVYLSVSSPIEASSAIDAAIADHLVGLVLDFSPMGADYNPATQFEHSCEFSSHVSLSYTYSADAPQILEVSIRYKAASASKTTFDPDGDERCQLPSANDILSRQSFSEEQRRDEDFSAFPIDLADLPTREVYNSEELWWAVEHGYRPVFAIEDSEAERIYNMAKDVLREIISKDMNEFEKALAIYEYLIGSVIYDRETSTDLDAIPSAENACYYLEGVFKYGKAVCDGKSKALVLLCGIEGISAVREFGYSDRDRAGHAWNYVRVDGVWYCVDTTGGDVFKPVGNIIASFYGRGVELINYKLFLAPLKTSTDKYVTSGLWQEITSGDLDASRISDVLVNRRSDALLESVSELAAMISAVIDAGYKEFSLTVSVSPELIERCVEGMSPIEAAFYIEDLPHNLIDEAMAELDLDGRLERKIFIESIDENKNYMYLFKLTPELSVA